MKEKVNVRVSKSRQNDFHVPNGESVLLELRSVEKLKSFIVQYFWAATNTLFLPYNIKYIKVEVSGIDIQNFLSALTV